MRMQATRGYQCGALLACPHCRQPRSLPRDVLERLGVLAANRLIHAIEDGTAESDDHTALILSDLLKLKREVTIADLDMHQCLPCTLACARLLQPPPPISDFPPIGEENLIHVALKTKTDSSQHARLLTVRVIGRWRDFIGF